ncbi:protein of unknown function (plasmid) [Rhodovastum atsumiense]|nr:protein of unknown function [Rhodovastum atsumiense]
MFFRPILCFPEPRRAAKAPALRSLGSQASRGTANAVPASAPPAYALKKTLWNNGLNQINGAGQASGRCIPAFSLSFALS